MTNVPVDFVLGFAAADTPRFTADAFARAALVKTLPPLSPVPETIWYASPFAAFALTLLAAITGIVLFFLLLDALMRHFSEEDKSGE